MITFPMLSPLILTNLVYTNRFVYGRRQHVDRSDKGDYFFRRGYGASLPWRGSACGNRPDFSSGNRCNLEKVFYERVLRQSDFWRRFRAMSTVGDKQAAITCGDTPQCAGLLEVALRTLSRFCMLLVVTSICYPSSCRSYQAVVVL